MYLITEFCILCQCLRTPEYIRVRLRASVRWYITYDIVLLLFMYMRY